MNASKNLTILCLIIAGTVPFSASTEDRGDTIDLSNDIAWVDATVDYIGYAGEQMLYVNYDGFSNADQAAQSFQYVVKYFSPFNIIVTNQLPAAEPYTTINVIDSTSQGGHAPVDCNNKNPSNVGEVFANPTGGLSAIILGMAVAHETAHTFGLDHVESTGSPPDIMVAVATPNGPEPVFRDECFELTGFECVQSHEKYCAYRQQNSYAELIGLFGPNPDFGDTDSSGDTDSEVDSDTDVGSDSDTDIDFDSDTDIDTDTYVDSDSDADEDDDEYSWGSQREDSSCGCAILGGQGSFHLVDLLVYLS